MRGLAAAMCAFPVLTFASQPWEGTPFSAPAAELARAAALVKPERAADVVVLLDEQSYRFDASNRLVHSWRVVYRVDSPQGIEEWGSVARYWEPWHQERPRIRARVITADGLEHLLDPKLLSDAPVRNDVPLIYDDAHIYQGPLPAVAVGAVVEREMVVTDTAPLFAAGFVDRAYVRRDVPVMHTKIILEAPGSLPLRHSVRLLPGMHQQQTQSPDGTAWTLENGPLGPLDEFESNLPPELAITPMVEISTGASWQRVAQAYRAATEPMIRLDEVKSVTDSHKPDASTLEIARRLVARLHREVRYTGIEFGESRLIPHSPRETLAQKFGDCKDKATLLVAMLRAAGIPAHLALLATGPGQDVGEELPGLGLFNHAIVYVPGPPELWIDATAQYTQVGDLPAGDRGRRALVIRDSTTALLRTPQAAPADNLVVEKREFHLAERGGARIVEITEPHGTVESTYRSWFDGPEKDEMRKQLKGYVQSTYLADSLTRFEALMAGNLDHPFELRVEVAKGERGYTDDNESVVAIPLAGIANRLPDYFSEKSQDPRKKQSDPAEAAKPARTADVVFEPFVTEWRYQVYLPPGYQVRALPSDVVKEYGPARFTQKFVKEPDGTVSGTLRFDSVKGRYTVAEAAATRKALAELNAAPAMTLNFESIGQAKLTSGDIPGALSAFEQLAALHPKEALHRVQVADALLSVGLAERARREAAAATKLDPGSALAWRTLGWTLQHDMVGRRFGKGFDLNGAVAAYRKAKALDPEDAAIVADLAILLEHDSQGRRYSADAQLEAAIEEYRARKKLLEQSADDDLADNLGFALFYAGRFNEVKDAMPANRHADTQEALLLAARAAMDGSASAIEDSYRVSGGEAGRSQALVNAGAYLIRVRRYSLAADLLGAGAATQKNAAALSQRLDAVRATKRHEDIAIAENDPRGFLQRMLIAGFGSGANREASLKFISPLALDTGSTQTQQALVQQLTAARHLARAAGDLPEEVKLDFMLSNVTYSVEGDDARGYRVRMQAQGAQPMHAYLVKEDGQFHLLGDSQRVSPLGQAALERIAAGDLDGARRWLDWARDSQRPAGGDDPLDGPLLPRFWKKGQPADRASMQLAAAALLANSPYAKHGLEILERARQNAAGDDERLNIDLALAHADLTLERWEPLLQVATGLARAAPDSGTAFRFEQAANRSLKHWGEIEAEARARLARLPDDSAAMYALAGAAAYQHQYERIRPALRPILSGSHVNPSDYNDFAWYAFLAPPIDQEVLDAARNAYGQTQGRSAPILHTLACLYAASGKAPEARELLLQAMNVWDLDEPNEPSWFGFGLIAEAYGDTDSALRYYERVGKPDQGEPAPGSSYHLAQQRLIALRKK